MHLNRSKQNQRKTIFSEKFRERKIEFEKENLARSRRVENYMYMAMLLENPFAAFYSSSERDKREKCCSQRPRRLVSTHSLVLDSLKYTDRFCLVDVGYEQALVMVLYTN